MNTLITSPTHWVLLALFTGLLSEPPQLTAADETLALRPAAGDWPWWRGPQRNGHADDSQQAPTQWAAGKNVAWKSPVPGRGHSSPTVVGNIIAMQTADEIQETQSVVAFDRRTGKQLWQQIINRGGLPERIHPKNSHATSTVASDGKRLFAAAFHHESIHLTTLSLDGKPLWNKKIGPFRPQEYRNGYAASPILYGDHVIVLAECDDLSYMVALERTTGNEIWRTKRPSNISYSSPVIGRVAGRDQILIGGCHLVAGFDPTNGRRLWATKATTMATSGTLVWHDDLVFASGGFPDAETVCVKADGSGDIVWRNTQKCYEQSMIVYQGFVYAMNDAGIMFCWRGSDGKEMWKHRLQGPISASPVLVNGNLYIANERGTTFILQATPTKYREIARNELGNSVFATPSICGGRVYLRVAEETDGKRSETLYAIENAQSTNSP